MLSQIEGSSTVVWGAHREMLRPGQTCLLPASLGEVTVEPENGPCALLKSYVPDLLRDAVLPLRQAGVADDAIAGLGAMTQLNSLKSRLAFG